MSEDILRTAEAANDMLRGNPTPEQLTTILQWSKKILETTIPDFANEPLTRVSQVSLDAAAELARIYEPRTGVRAAIKRLMYAEPTIDPDSANLVLQALPGNKVPMHVIDAMLKAGGKSNLTKILGKPDLPYEQKEIAAKALLAMELTPSELIRLASVVNTSAQALERITAMPFDHDLYLEAVKSAKARKGSTTQSRIALSVLIDKLLPHVNDPEELNLLLDAADNMTAVRVAVRYAAFTDDIVILQQVYNLACAREGAAQEILKPIFEKILQKLPDDAVLQGYAVEHGRGTTQPSHGKFRYHLIQELSGPNREKIIRLLRNSQPSVDELEMILASSTDEEEQIQLAREIMTIAMKRRDGFILTMIAEKYHSKRFGRTACEHLIRGWNLMKGGEDAPKKHQIRHLQTLYPGLVDQLAMLLPADQNDAMDRMKEDLR